MSTQIYDLEVVQMGVQTSRDGTAVPATHVVDFTTAELKINRHTQRTHRSGSLATAHRVDPTIADYELTIKTVGTYDRIACMLPMFIAPQITASSTVSAGSAYGWAFTPSDTSDNLKAATFQVGGVDTWPTEFILAGCVGKSLEIDIKADALWDCTWTFVPQTLASGTKTGSLTAPATLVDIVGYTTKVYIDTTTIHTTQITGRVLTAKIKIDLGTTGRYYLGASGGQAGNVLQTGHRNVTLDMTQEWQATTEYTAWNNGTERKISIDAVGPALGTATYEARFDFYGLWESWQLGNDGGAITEQISAAAIYDTTATTDVSASITNSINTIP